MKRYSYMRNKKIIFYFFSVLCVISSICFYTWKEKQTEKYLALKANMLENNIQNIAMVNSTLLEKVNTQVEEKQE